MEILEYFIKGKSQQHLCEDELVKTDAFIAVIDGVTPKSDYTCRGKSTGRLAADFVRDALLTAEPEADCAAVLALCRRKWEEFYEQVDFPYDRAEKGPQAAAAIYSVRRREIWMIGDCQALVDGVLHVTPKRSDVILSEFRSLVMHLSEDADHARSLIEPWILKSVKFANSRGNYGYSVLNGEEIPPELIERISLDENSHEIVLASDGYPRLMPALVESEKELEAVLKEDPQCCSRFPSTKGLQPGNESFDDRTYIRFRV